MTMFLFQDIEKGSANDTYVHNCSNLLTLYIFHPLFEELFDFVKLFCDLHSAWSVRWEDWQITWKADGLIIGIYYWVSGDL